MVLLSKEFYVNLKELTNLHVTVNTNDHWDGTGVLKQSKQWQVFIHGILNTNATHQETFETSVNCDSKEDAYRLFKDLARQIIDSGEVSELQSKLFDEVLTEEKGKE